MWLNQRADYAVRLAVELACLPEGSWTTTREVAQRQGIPERFVAKIITQAVTAGVVKTRRGTGGGLALAKAAKSISLLEVVEAVERPLALSKCTLEPGECLLSNRCAVHPVLDRVLKQIRDVLAQTTIAELARAQNELVTCKKADATKRGEGKRAIKSTTPPAFSA